MNLEDAPRKKKPRFSKTFKYIMAFIAMVIAVPSFYRLDKPAPGPGPSKAEQSNLNNPNGLKDLTKSDELSNADLAWHAANTYGWDCQEIKDREEPAPEGYFMVSCSSGIKLRVYPRDGLHPKITKENGGY